MTERSGERKWVSGGWSQTGRCPAWDTRIVQADSRRRQAGTKTTQVRCILMRGHEGPHEQRGKQWET